VPGPGRISTGDPAVRGRQRSPRRGRDRTARLVLAPALGLAAAALASCSQALDFSTFRFVDEHDARVTDATADGAPPDDGPVDAGPAIEAGADDGPSLDDAAIADDGPSVDDGAIADARVDAPTDAGFDAPAAVARSCAELLRRGSVASGSYTIDPDGDPTTRAIVVYCEQRREGGGWQRVVAFADGVGCPPVLAADLAQRTCVRRPGPGETVSAFRVTPLVAYSEVLGRAAFRARGGLDAFDNPAEQLTAEGAFVDGVTVSRVGTVDGVEAREHAFTWAITESNPPPRISAACPCAGGRSPIPAAGGRHLCRALLDLARDGGSADAGEWREPEQPWLGSSAPCAAGDPAGWIRAMLSGTAQAPLDVRLTVSGAIVDGGALEELGVAALEVYVR
jgi:hypothetical protein